VNIKRTGLICIGTIPCRTGQQPLQECPEGACRSFVLTKDDMIVAGEEKISWKIV